MTHLEDINYEEYHQKFVNISSKDQGEFKVFHKETKETTDMKELTEVREILEEN